MIATCTVCGHLYEAGSEEQAYEWTPLFRMRQRTSGRYQATEKASSRPRAPLGSRRCCRCHRNPFAQGRKVVTV